MNIISNLLLAANPYMLWIKIGLVTLVLAGAFYAGLQTQYIIERARENERKVDHEKQLAVVETSLHSVVEEQNKIRYTLKAENKVLKDRISDDAKNNKDYSCPVPDNAIKLLRQ